tara:strand:+ start:2129 stop:2761 length:633 start_codon:yes stop_codon:yes gene_type:complete
MIPFETFVNESRIEIPEDEIELLPENIIVNPEYDYNNIINTVNDLNDKRERSDKKWTEYESIKNASSKDDIEKELSDSKKHLEDLKKQIEERNKEENKDKNKTQNKENNNNSNSSNAVKGTVLVSYDINGRKHTRLDAPGYTCRGAGKIGIKVKVDRYGDVIYAKFDPSKSTSSAACMIEIAIKYAQRKSRFNTTNSSNEGWIYYIFVAQ